MKQLFFAFILLGPPLFNPGLQASSAQTIKPRILKIIPHTNQGFTQGLHYYEGKIYEGTGLVGQSKVIAIDPTTGNIIKSVPLLKYFGEGITVARDKIYQLTWKAGKALVYNVTSLQVMDTLFYNGEGWGLTHFQKNLIMSNGSDTLYFRNFNNFKINRKLRVKIGNSPISQLNELEYAEGKIYANVWYRNQILEIDPKTGSVMRIIDCSELFKIENPTPNQVLNGIAFIPEKKTFLFTGKNWKNIFEVKLPDFP